jgi:hypothetical protein
MWVVVVLRYKGRHLLPLALAAETQEDAEFNVTLLDSLRVPDGTSTPPAPKDLQ